MGLESAPPLGFVRRWCAQSTFLSNSLFAFSSKEKKGQTLFYTFGVEETESSIKEGVAEQG